MLHPGIKPRSSAVRVWSPNHNHQGIPFYRLPRNRSQASMLLLCIKCKKNISLEMARAKNWLESNKVREKVLDHGWPSPFRWQRARQAGPDYREKSECLVNQGEAIGRWAGLTLGRSNPDCIHEWGSLPFTQFAAAAVCECVCVCVHLASSKKSIRKKILDYPLIPTGLPWWLRS